MHNMDICDLKPADRRGLGHGENKTLPKRSRRVAAADPARFLRLSEMRIAAYAVFVVHLCIEIIAQYARLLMLKRMN